MYPNIQWNTRLITLTSDNQPFGYIALFANKGSWPSIGGVRILEQDFDNKGFNLALSLAHTMQQKAHCIGFDMSGAKAVIYVPKNKDRKQLLKDFALAINNIDGEYVTAVDIGSSCQDMNLIARYSKFVTCHQSSNYRDYSASYYTALGVFQAIKCCYKYKFSSLADSCISIQGLGKVGLNLIKLIKQQLPNVTINATDIAIDRCQLVQNTWLNVNVVSDDEIYQIPSDIFIAAAASNIITESQAKLINTKIFVSAANNPFKNSQTQKILNDNNTLVLPDYIVNTGGLVSCVYQYKLISQQQCIEKIYQIGLNAERYINNYQAQYNH